MSRAPQARVVLASGSPRRRQLLALIGLAYEVEPAGVEEHPEPGERGDDFALRAARDKAAAVAARHPDAAVLAADTVVELEGTILGKPESAAEAAAMLAALSGRWHAVHTAVALRLGESEEALVDTARVRFVELDAPMVDWYVASGEPLDKAGAYAIQGLGGLFVAAVEGSPHTVVGLPIHRLGELFAACGLELWDWISRGRSL